MTDGARSQSQRGSNVEVVQVTDAGKGSGLVDDDAASFHTQTKLGNLLFLGGIDVQGSRVTGTAFQHQLVANVIGLVQRLSLVHAQQGSQLLVGPCAVVRGVVGLIDQDLGVIRNVDTSHFCEAVGSLANRARLNAVGLGVKENFGNLGGLVIFQEVATGFLQ